MVLESNNEFEPGWYVIHTTLKVEDESELQTILSIIQNVAPYIAANIGVSYNRLNSWKEVDDYL